MRFALIRDFATRVAVAFPPGSLLEVGCGDGAVSRALRARGFRPVGLEAGIRPRRLADFSILRGDATALPFPDASFDLISLRHVLHHLPDPARALAEARRVARRGIVAAEPAFDPTLPGQDAGRAIEDWSRRVDRHEGRWHELGHGRDDLVRFLPEMKDARLALVVPSFPRRAAAFVAEHVARLRDDEEGRALRAEGAALLERARRDAPTRPGSLIAVLDLARSPRRRESGLL
ncbi:MAG: class I SAM-dependent methyltransferase [Planctomycetota bacterium]